MNLTIIAAIGKNRELGKNNELIWKFKEDMKFFKDNTIGKKIIMGRKTFESLPKVLPGRKHLVLSRKKIDIDAIETFKSKEELLNYLKELKEEVMIIGGATVYKEFIGYSNKMLITLIEDTCKEADTYFPEINEEQWDIRMIDVYKENGIRYKHLEYTRKI